jgi:hypothetical protein
VKAASTTFFCDEPKCRERVTVIEEEDTAAYLELVMTKCWNVERPLRRDWKQFCPSHWDPSQREGS